jgi:membrane-associated phospholipid phosphatase
MPFAEAAWLHSLLWPTVTRLGEAQLMLPTGLVLAAWLAWSGEARAAKLWVAMLALAVGLTTASKIAFIGWGIGIPSLNFTGISGHAMQSAAVFPLLLRCITASSSRQTQHIAVALGYAVAALIAISRVVVGAHSPPEALAGFALGAAASAIALGFNRVPPQHLPRWLLALLVAAQFLNPAALPSLPTHDVVTEVALWMSGHEKPYTRGMMLRRERQRLKELQLAAHYRG